LIWKSLIVDCNTWFLYSLWKSVVYIILEKLTHNYLKIKLNKKYSIFSKNVYEKFIQKQTSDGYKMIYAAKNEYNWSQVGLLRPWDILDAIRVSNYFLVQLFFPQFVHVSLFCKFRMKFVYVPKSIFLG